MQTVTTQQKSRIEAVIKELNSILDEAREEDPENDSVIREIENALSNLEAIDFDVEVDDEDEEGGESES